LPRLPYFLSSINAFLSPALPREEIVLIASPRIFPARCYLPFQSLLVSLLSFPPFFCRHTQRQHRIPGKGTDFILLRFFLPPIVQDDPSRIIPNFLLPLPPVIRARVLFQFVPPCFTFSPAPFFCCVWFCALRAPS